MYLTDLCLFVRLQQLEEENSELRSCVPCLRANIERLEEVRIMCQLLVCHSPVLSLESSKF